MTLRTLLMIAGSCVSMSLGIAAEDAPADHQKWMKDLGSQTGQMRKGIDVEKNAMEMQMTLKEVAAFWKTRSSEIALKTCNDSSAGAAEVVKAAQAGDKAGIAAGMKNIGAGCKGCHDVHREKVSETAYRIK